MMNIGFNGGRIGADFLAVVDARINAMLANREGDFSKTAGVILEMFSCKA